MLTMLRGEVLPRCPRRCCCFCAAAVRASADASPEAGDGADAIAAFTMCQQCCLEAHPGDCPAHAKAAGKKREEEELLALLYATAAPAAAQPPKPRVEHYEEALESVGDTVTLFCLADFLRSRHAEEALEKSRRRREEGAQTIEAARRRTANARGRAR